MKNSIKPELRVTDKEIEDFEKLSGTEKYLLQYWLHKFAYRHPYQNIGKFMDDHFSTEHEPISSLMSNFKPKL